MLLQQLLNGLALGATYGLIALGYSMVYGIIQLINFAHGEVFMAGAFVGLLLVAAKLPLAIALLGAMVVCALLGMLVERLAYRPLRRSSRLSALISAIGVSIVLSSLALLLFGANARGFPEGAVAVSQVSFGGGEVSSLQLLILAVATLLMLALHYLVRHTRVGRAMRAVAEDYTSAALMGIDVDRTVALTFAIGSALAAAGGVLVGVQFNAVSFNMGLLIGLKAFAAAVLGGIGSLPGAMLGGLLLGVAEVGAVAAGYSSYRDAIAFAILVLVLLLRPTGLLGQPVQRKV